MCIDVDMGSEGAKWSAVLLNENTVCVFASSGKRHLKVGVFLLLLVLFVVDL